jgi:CRISPR-associated protein Cas5d
MSFGIKLRVWGDWACFTRPEMKVERVSYEVITPSAARAVIEAIYWKPSIRWIIDQIHILKPIKFDNIRRNELENKLSSSTILKAIRNNNTPVETFIEDNRQQRASMILRDVDYVIKAHFESNNEDGHNEGKHLDMFNRRLRKGQCYYNPYLGTREFSANFSPVESIPISKIQEERDLGWMFYDFKYEDDTKYTPRFFHAYMTDGIINVPHPDSKEVKE